MARVLVVEDDDVTRELLEARLVLAGHWVRVASSVAEATTVLRRIGIPDVLVSDMFMPGGSGLALVESVRDGEGAALPVIFLSGRALPGDVEAGRALGATYLTKPVAAADLLASVEAAVAAGAPSLQRLVLDHLGHPAELPGDASGGRRGALLADFCEHAPPALEAVLDALAAGDAPGVQAAARALGTAARSVGAGPLARVCADLEDRARTGGALVPEVAGPLLRHEVAATLDVVAAVAEQAGAVADEPRRAGEPALVAS